MSEKEDYLGQVQRGIDFIEQNLDNDISLAAVAHHASISQWHFQRIFKALTTETLKAYIRSRRLANAMQKLIVSNEKILDIALATGYESQESFTRAFKSAFDFTPNEFRRLADRSLFPQKVQIDYDYLQHIHSHVSLEPQIIEQQQMSLVGMHTQFYSVDSEKNNIGEKLPRLWHDFQLRSEEIRYRIAGLNYGVVQQSTSTPEQLDYYAAVQVKQTSELPDGMSAIDIPASTYAKFSHRGAASKIDNTVNYIYSSWMLGSEHRHNYGPDLEIYNHLYHPTSDDSTMYYAVPIGSIS
jgi:AraC family transcriptional regulator